MSRQALLDGRGLQAERTAMAWTRTALAIAASGVLVLLRDGHNVNLGRDPLHLGVVVTVVAIAAAVYLVGAYRRHQLLAHPRDSAAAGRRYLPAVGIAVIVVGVLVVTYLALPVV